MKESSGKGKAIAQPRLLVVFPCLNEEDYLEELVRGFIAALKNEPVQFVIVDGGSTDRSPLIAAQLAREFSHLALLVNVKRLQGAALNMAVEAFHQECTYVIRVDVHAAYPDDFCQKLVEEAEKMQADSVVVSMEAKGRNWFQKAVAIAQNSVLGNGGSMHRRVGIGGHWVDHGHHALMRISAFRAVGGYDEAFSHNEDAELDLRLVRAGYKIWLTDATSVTYYPRSTAAKLFSQYYNYGAGRAQNILKNKGRIKLRQLAPASIAPVVFLGLLSPWCWIAAVPVVLWGVACLGYGLWLGLAQRSLLGIAAGASAMIMHMGWSLGFIVGGARTFVEGLRE